MLVLTRRIGEEIVIADDIHVIVLSIKGKQARLGIAAPRSVPVARAELLARTPPHHTELEDAGATRRGGVVNGDLGKVAGQH